MVCSQLENVVTATDTHPGPSSNISFISQISHAMATAAGGDVNRPPRDLRVDGTIMSLSRPASPIGGAQNFGNSISSAVDIYTLPPETDMLHLIRLFFSDTGMLFPYIHEGALLETFALAKRNNFTAVRRSWLCLLNMILAFATCVSARPDLPVEMNAAESDIFLRRAQALSGKMVFKSANLEIGKDLPLSNIALLALNSFIDLEISAISPLNDSVSSRNSAIVSDVEPSWLDCQSSSSTWATYF